MELNGKRVLLVGMARSGIAAAKLLCELGAHVTISDLKEESAFDGALSFLHEMDCVFALGEKPDAYIAGQDIMVISPGIAWAKDFIERDYQRMKEMNEIIRKLEAK